MLIITDTDKMISKGKEELKKFSEDDIIICFNEGKQTVDISFVNLIKSCKAQITIIPEEFDHCAAAFLVGRYYDKGSDFVKLDKGESIMEHIQSVLPFVSVESDEPNKKESPVKEKTEKKSLFGIAANKLKPKKEVEKEPEPKVAEKQTTEKESKADKKEEVPVEEPTPVEMMEDPFPEESAPENVTEESPEINDNANAFEPEEDDNFDEEFRPFEEINEEIDTEEFTPEDEVDDIIYNACKESSDPVIRALIDSRVNMLNIKEVIMEASDDNLGIQIMLGLKFDKRMAGKLMPFTRDLYNKVRK